MGHDHDHDHSHGHDHHHVHDHSHGHDHHHGHHGHDQTPSSGLEDKLARLLGHWAKHNHEHAQSYRQWADQARKAQLTAVADLLEAVAAQTQHIAEQLEGGIASMPRKP